MRGPRINFNSIRILLSLEGSNCQPAGTHGGKGSYCSLDLALGQFRSKQDFYFQILNLLNFIRNLFLILTVDSTDSETPLILYSNAISPSHLSIHSIRTRSSPAWGQMVVIVNPQKISGLQSVDSETLIMYRKMYIISVFVCLD